MYKYRYFVNSNLDNEFYDSTVYFIATPQKTFRILKDNTLDLSDFWTTSYNLKYCLRVYKELTEREIIAKFGPLPEYFNKNNKPARKNNKTKENNMENSSKFILIAKPTRLKLKYKNGKGEIKDYSGAVIQNDADSFVLYCNGRGIRRFNHDGIINLGLENN